MPTRREALLADFMEAVWNRGEASAAGRYLAARYTIRHDPGDPWEGQTLDVAGFCDRLVQSRAPFPDQRFEVRHMAVAGDEVMITWLWRATHQGEVAGFPPTGREIRMSGATVYGFDAEDRLTGHWQVTDRLGLFQQLAAQRG
jgi:predicted ester cyclase